MSELRMNIDSAKARFIDRTGAAPETNQFWAPVVIAREEIEAEVERLAKLPISADGRRESLIVHPLAPETAPGLAPGIRVTLSVLKPGERTRPLRHNATEVNFCITGSGHTLVGNQRIAFHQYDVWNHPSYTTYCHINDSDSLQVRLTYSNAPLLQHMQVYIVDDNPPPEHAAAEQKDEAHDDPRRKSPYGMFDLGDGALMMPYEKLIDPPVVETRPLHWPWEKVKRELDKLEALDKDYVGRRLYMMYNPATGRTHGCTPNFFATMTIRPPKIVDRPHRHTSAAVNYYFAGRGRSTVEGRVYEWKAGDLMLSAPGWAVHNHASYDEAVYELTVQDQPLHIAMESILWQESLKMPLAVLGQQEGFSTNRARTA